MELKMVDFQTILAPYNPWWGGTQTKNLPEIPSFQRPIFFTLAEDLERIPQMLSIIGPRRIGKSTLLMQIIHKLLETGIHPQRILYYSFDDPALMTPEVKINALIDFIMKKVSSQKQEGPTYLFLDEIQRLELWELYLKKYYDLKYPMKVIISGSASSPIFKKSRESLLGRVKDYHLLPFSFREYVLYELRENPALSQEIQNIYEKGETIQGILTEDPNVSIGKVRLEIPAIALQEKLNSFMQKFFLEGGFPEVWQLPSWMIKQEYLYDNQIKKVIYEDLVLAAEFRKPELLKRFYISLLEMPGRELNVLTIHKETEIKPAQIDKYMPLLEMTDLIYRISKFRSKPLRVRKGMMKFYLVDLALRNAILRLTDTLLTDDATLGLYAENLVFLALKKWKGTIQMDYYRERGGEVDFIVHTGPHRFLPVEVKYRNQFSEQELQGIRKFVARFPKSGSPIIVTKLWSDFGQHNTGFYIPLPMFLLLFD
jgi:hypothetical protein